MRGLDSGIVRLDEYPYIIRPGVYFVVVGRQRARVAVR